MNVKIPSGIRIYELRSKEPGKPVQLIRWGMSRNGKHDDKEMESAVYGNTKPGGNFQLYVVFSPKPTRFHTPEQMLHHRIRTLKARLRRKTSFDLFYRMYLAEELKKSKYSIEGCTADWKEKMKAEQSFLEQWTKGHPGSKQIKL